MTKEELYDDGCKMIAMLANIRRLRRDQEKCWDELEDIARLMLQGIDPKEIKCYGYDPLKDKRREDIWGWRYDVYNYVVLNSGEQVMLDPPLPVRKQPETPEPLREVKVTLNGRDYTVIMQKGKIVKLGCEGRWPVMDMTPASFGNKALWDYITVKAINTIRYEDSGLEQDKP